MSSRCGRLFLVTSLVLSIHPATWGKPPDVHLLPRGAVARMGGADTGHTGPVFSIVFSPDGQFLASASGDGTVRLWDVATGNEIRRFRGHQGEALSVSFAPDGKTLASAGNDQTIRLWAVGSGQELRRFQGHSDGIEAVAFSPDGKTLASGSRDHTVRLWEVATGRALRQLKGHQNKVTSVAFSRDGKTLASGSRDRRVRLWEVATGKPIGRPLGHYGWVLCLAFSADGKLLATAGRDQLIHVREVATGKKLREFGGYEGPVESVALSADGKTVVSGSDDKLVHVWETLTGKERLRFEGHKGLIHAVALSPDGMTVASGSDDHTILVWDLRTGRNNRLQQAAQLSADDMEALWTDLAGADAARAYQALWILSAAPKKTLPFLKEHLEPILMISVRVSRLVSELDDGRYAVRRKANQELEKSGELAIPALRLALQAKPSLEVRQRLLQILDKLAKQEEGGSSSERVRVLRVIEVLEHIGTVEARQQLEALAKRAPEAPLIDEAKAALERGKYKGRTKP